ncbi:hypothetical protein GCM10022220_27160 [Actinocatenispora rupis]|uniref:Excreted virulence factor EspC, type VII ESX diderm n=1 Tax=Actinocatenispora rupis TaxID=519421 RepID=A0A8J3IZE3_9ACTN|nr:hypothetical protein Aru02nite_22820 [Actinocatenispora rupis]
MHPIDAAGSTGKDLTHASDGRSLRADARHLGDVAAELENLAEYFDKDLKAAANKIRSLTHPTAVDGARGYGGAMADWTNPSGRFADADELWRRYGQAAASAGSFSEQLHGAIADLAEGTRTIAKRYTSTEARNDLIARQIENVLTSSSADDRSTGGYAGDDSSPSSAGTGASASGDTSTGAVGSNGDGYGNGGSNE